MENGIHVEIVYIPWAELFAVKGRKEPSISLSLFSNFILNWDSFDIMSFFRKYRQGLMEISMKTISVGTIEETYKLFYRTICHRNIITIKLISFQRFIRNNVCGVLIQHVLSLFNWIWIMIIVKLCLCTSEQWLVIWASFRTSGSFCSHWRYSN